MIYTKHVKMGITWREYANYSLFIFITIFSLIQSTNQISFILNPIEWFIEAKHSSRESDQTTKKKWIKTKRHELYYLISLLLLFLAPLLLSTTASKSTRRIQLPQPTTNKSPSINTNRCESIWFPSERQQNIQINTWARASL